MSRDIAEVSTDFLDRSGAVVTAVPLFFSAWVNFDDATGGDAIISVGVSGSGNNLFSVRSNSGTGFIASRSRDASAAVTLVGNVAHSTSLWEHVAAAWDTNKSANWLNGINKVSTSTTTKVPTGINYTLIGQETDGTNLLDGRIAHIAIWSMYPTDEEVAALGAYRVSPLTIRPGSLAAYYPFIGRDSPEVDIIGGNSLTVHGTTVSASDPPVLWLPGRRKFFLPAAGPAPAFSSGPAINSTTTSSYTLGYTPTAAATFYAIAIVCDGTVPTAAQVIAGVDYAGGDVVAAVNEAVTGADTTVLGGALTRPVHDVYCVLNNGSGSSSVAALHNSILTAPSGRQYFTAVEPGGGWDTESIFYGGTPAAESEDMGDVSDTMTAISGGGEACEIGGDGIPFYTPIPSDDLTRRTITKRWWDKSVDDWSDASPVIFYINNQAPAAVPNFTVTETAGAFDYDLAPNAGDVEGDAMVWSINSGSMTGCSVVANHMVGTAVEGTYVVEFLITDTPGDPDTCIITFVIGNLAIPDVVNEHISDGMAQIEASGFAATIAYVYFSAHAVGTIIDQDPDGGTQAPPGTIVTLYVATEYDDSGLAELLDPGDTGKGVRIIRRKDAAPDTISYYVFPNTLYAGRCRWVDVNAGDSDLAKYDAIIAALEYPPLQSLGPHPGQFPQ